LCHLQLRHWEDAHANLTVCLWQRPDFVWARVLRGLAGVERAVKHKAPGEFAAARADLDYAEKKATDPTLRYATLVNRGVLFLRRQQWESAITDLSAATTLDREGLQAWLNLADAYQGARQWNPAQA